MADPDHAGLMRFPFIPLAALALGAALFLIIPFRGPRNVGTSPEVTPVMAEYASHHWPGTTVSDLKRGRHLLIERCTECHHRPGPEMAQAAQWADVLELMATRAKLSAGDREAILHYLLSAKMTQN